MKSDRHDIIAIVFYLTVEEMKTINSHLLQTASSACCTEDESAERSKILSFLTVWTKTTGLDVPFHPEDCILDSGV